MSGEVRRGRQSSLQRENETTLIYTYKTMFPALPQDWIWDGLRYFPCIFLDFAFDLLGVLTSVRVHSEIHRVTPSSPPFSTPFKSSCMHIGVSSSPPFFSGIALAWNQLNCDPLKKRKKRHREINASRFLLYMSTTAISAYELIKSMIIRWSWSTNTDRMVQ